MTYRTLVTLADLHHGFGIIGIGEYIERCEVAGWLFDTTGLVVDPRDPDGEDGERRREEGEGPADGDVTVGTADPIDPDDPGNQRLLLMGWMFTKGDPDPYPSAPHGHWRSKDRKWPKLNPYTGRVYARNESEDVSRRLDRMQLHILWRDEAFKDFCRSHLVWFVETYPHHVFPVPKDRLFSFPRYRAR